MWKKNKRRYLIGSGGVNGSIEGLSENGNDVVNIYPFSLLEASDYLEDILEFYGKKTVLCEIVPFAKVIGKSKTKKPIKKGRK